MTILRFVESPSVTVYVNRPRMGSTHWSFNIYVACVITGCQVPLNLELGITDNILVNKNTQEESESNEGKELKQDLPAAREFKWDLKHVSGGGRGSSKAPCLTSGLTKDMGDKLSVTNGVTDDMLKQWVYAFGVQLDMQMDFAKRLFLSHPTIYTPYVWW